MSVQEITNFLRLNKLDNQKNIVNDFKNNTNNQNTAYYINKNLDKLDDNEKGHLLITLLDNKKISLELLKFELKYLTLDKKISDFQEFIDFTRESLIRYHIISGNLCEDNEWTEFYPNSTKYSLKKGEMLFENSLKRINKYDSQIVNYIDNLLNFFKRHKTDNINIIYRHIAYNDGIYWMVFKIIDNRLKKS